MRTVALLLIMAFAGCHKDEPQAPTAEQSAQLNEAEDMLNNMPANEEGPADRSTGPSNSTE